MALVITKKYKDRVAKRMLEIAKDPIESALIDSEIVGLQTREDYMHYVKEAYARGVIEDRLNKYKRFK